jgi:DNA-binding response OmpR family regulator
MPRILIVDDNEALRSLIRDRLADNYEVFDTGDPQLAFAMTLQHRPDAILLDLSMPGLSGLELCQALSSLSFTKHIPIFIVSGGDARNKTFCQNLGAAAYFEKPIDFKALKSRLAEVLTTKKPERRADVRVQLRVRLKLKATDKDGKAFEVGAVTENMSLGGFLCSCPAALEVGAAVEVFLCSDDEFYLGSARVVGAEATNTLHPRYRFQFIEKVSGG